MVLPKLNVFLVKTWVERVVYFTAVSPPDICASGDLFAIVFGEADPPSRRTDRSPTAQLPLSRINQLLQDSAKRNSFSLRAVCRARQLAADDRSILPATRHDWFARETVSMLRSHRSSIGRVQKIAMRANDRALKGKA